MKTNKKKNVKKKFVTIFPAAENVHLVKDVGQIPYFMSRKFGYESTLVTYKNSDCYEYVNSELNGIKIHFLKPLIKFLGVDVAIVLYLIRKSKEISVLNFYHFQFEKLVYFIIYKALNKTGKIYLKLDLDLDAFRRIGSFSASNTDWKRKVENILERWILKKVDVLSAETFEAIKTLKECYPCVENKIVYIPNGIDEYRIRDLIYLKKYDEKENLIISVGRIGAHQKHTELLIEAFANLIDRGYKLILIGPVEHGFKDYLDNMILKKPSLSANIALTGNITDRAELYNWYNRSKIFCLSSRYEGFPIAAVESTFFGNLIVTTNIAAANDLTNFGKLGCVSKSQSVKDYTSAIECAISLVSYQLSEKIKGYSAANYVWNSIVGNIDAALKVESNVRQINYK